MPNKLWYLLVMVWLFFSSETKAQYNFDAIEKLWNITDLLRNDEMPEEALWKDLFNSKAYKLKRPEKNYTDQVKLSLVLAFMPSKQEILKENIKNNVLLQRASRFALLEPYLKRHILWIQENNLLDSMQLQADKLLPTALYNCYPEPVIYFRYLDYDASADAKGIFMDLLLSYDVDRYKAGVFGGHELFHYILAACEARRFSENIPPQHQAVMRIIRQLSEEGTADLIDKPFLLQTNSPLMTKTDFLKLHEGLATKKIIEINAALESLAADSATYTRLEAWERLIPVNAHIPGLFMAQTISEEGHIQELVLKINNPFQFFYLYNQAAMQVSTKPPRFSETAIAFLKHLEKQYWFSP